MHHEITNTWGTRKTATKIMNATKLIRNAVEKNLGVTMKECDLLFQARNWGEVKETTFDAAIIMINACNEIYAIRAWHNGINKTYMVDSGLKDAIIKIMLLDI